MQCHRIFKLHIKSTVCVRYERYQNQAHAVNRLSIFTTRSPVQWRLPVDVWNSHVGISFRQQFDVVPGCRRKQPSVGRCATREQREILEIEPMKRRNFEPCFCPGRRSPPCRAASWGAPDTCSTCGASTGASPFDPRCPSRSSWRLCWAAVSNIGNFPEMKFQRVLLDRCRSSMRAPPCAQPSAEQCVRRCPSCWRQRLPSAASRRTRGGLPTRSTWAGFVQTCRRCPDLERELENINTYSILTWRRKTGRVWERTNEEFGERRLVSVERRSVHGRDLRLVAQTRRRRIERVHLRHVCAERERRWRHGRNECGVDVATLKYRNKFNIC